MEKESIIVKINSEGEIRAETLGFEGAECMDELNRLLKDLADLKEEIKKPEYYRSKVKKVSQVEVIRK